MKTLKFKSNIMCGSCLADVKPILDEEKNIDSWNVDLKNPERTLEIKSDTMDANAVQELLKNAGYNVTLKS